MLTAALAGTGEESEPESGSESGPESGSESDSGSDSDPDVRIATVTGVTAQWISLYAALDECYTTRLPRRRTQPGPPRARASRPTDRPRSSSARRSSPRGDLRTRPRDRAWWHGYRVQGA